MAFFSVPVLYSINTTKKCSVFILLYIFLDSFQWANDLACQLCAVHSEEVARRQNFQTQFDGHMLATLFPGLEDSPPAFATQAPESFDTNLPKVAVLLVKAV